MEIQQMIEEHNENMEKISQRMQELKIEHRKRTHKEFVMLALVSLIEAPFAISSAIGYLRFMPLHLASCVICSFCTGMAYQRYFDAKHMVDTKYL